MSCFPESSNAVLRTLTWGLTRPKAAYEHRNEQLEHTPRPTVTGCAMDAAPPTNCRVLTSLVWYQSLSYQTLGRLVRCAPPSVCKLTYDANGAQRHFYLSRPCPTQTWSSQPTHAVLLSQGQRWKIGFWAPARFVSTDRFCSSTTRREKQINCACSSPPLLVIPVQALRQHCLTHSLAQAQLGTVASSCSSKVAAQFISVRRVSGAFSSTWTGQSHFQSCLPPVSPATASTSCGDSSRQMNGL